MAPQGMRLPYLTTSGPPEDVENFARQRGVYGKLPDPPGNIPFNQQGEQILDFQQKHAEAPQVSQMKDPNYPNPLFYGHFVGTTTQQIHNQKFQSVNEQLVWD